MDFFDADFNQELPTGDETVTTGDMVSAEQRALATYNENKTVLWYLDDSFSMVRYLSRGADSDNRKSKIQIAREVASKLVQDRMEQFKKSAVAVFRFGEEVFRISRASNMEAVLQGIRNLGGNEGGTSLNNVFSHAVAWCEKNPNKVGMYHLVLVTDAEDSYFRAETYIPACLRLGIVVECTIISEGHNRGSEEDHGMKGLKLLCEATNGTFKMVGDSKSMEQAMLDAGTRLCLPPASN